MDWPCQKSSSGFNLKKRHDKEQTKLNKREILKGRFDRQYEIALGVVWIVFIPVSEMTLPKRSMPVFETEEVGEEVRMPMPGAPKSKLKLSSPADLR